MWRYYRRRVRKRVKRNRIIIRFKGGEHMTKKQQEYNKRWIERNRERKRYLSFKATAKTFIRHYADLKDLQELKELIKEKEKNKKIE